MSVRDYFEELENSPTVGDQGGVEKGAEHR